MKIDCLHLRKSFNKKTLGGNGNESKHYVSMHRIRGPKLYYDEKQAE